MENFTEESLIDFLDDYITFLDFIEKSGKFKKKHNLWCKRVLSNPPFEEPDGAKCIDGLDITGILEFYFHATHFNLRFLTISLYGKRLKLYQTNEQEKEFISKQIEFLNEIRIKEEKRAEIEYNKKLARGLQELEDIKFREKEERKIAKSKQEKLAVKKEVDSSSLVCAEVDEPSFMVQVLYSLMSQTPGTFWGVGVFIMTVLPAFYFFGGGIGLMLYMLFGLFCGHVIDTVIYVSGKEDEKQKALDIVSIKEKPKPKTYDEHIQEEDAELTRKIEALSLDTTE